MTALFALLPVLAIACTAAVPRPQEESDTGGGLRISVELEAASCPEGAQFLARARFENLGTSAVRYHVPPHAGLVPFPDWVLVRQDGARLVPHLPSFQSGFEAPGMLGTLVELAPGEHHVHEQRMTHFVPEGAASDSVEAATPLPLSPARYRLQARHQRSSTQVPFLGQDQQIQQREVPGLWVGEIAAEAALQILPPVEAQLRIHAPRECAPGRAWPMTISLVNPGPQPLEGPAHLELLCSAMGAPTVVARLSLDGRVRAVPGEQESAFQLAPDGRWHGQLDAAAVPAIQQRSEPVECPTLTAALRRGLFLCELHLVDAEGTVLVRSNVLRRYLLGGR